VTLGVSVIALDSACRVRGPAFSSFAGEWTAHLGQIPAPRGSAAW